MNGLALWQGPHHDVVCLDYGTLDEAARAFAAMSFDDDPRGTGIAPRDRLVRLRSEMTTLGWGLFVLDVQPLRRRPTEQGRVGAFGEFFWASDRLVCVTDSALVDISIPLLTTEEEEAAHHRSTRLGDGQGEGYDSPLLRSYGDEFVSGFGCQWLK